MNKNVMIIIGVVAVGFIALMAYSTMSMGGFRVEVCKEFQGRQACGSAKGSSQKDAVNAATTVACAKISSGMTDSMNCQSGEPVSVKWLQGN